MVNSLPMEYYHDSFLLWPTHDGGPRTIKNRVRQSQHPGKEIIFGDSIMANL